VVGEPGRSVAGVVVREEDLAPFAIADGLLAKMTVEATWHLTEPEMDLLLDRARDEWARASGGGLADVAAEMRQAFEAGLLAIQAGPEFAIVTMYGRLLIVMSRWDLRGICHPERN
jgi:hypothetical protein